MKTRHLVLSIAAIGLLVACSQSGFRNLEHTWGNWTDETLANLEMKAAGGDPEAQRMLGNMYYWGEYVDQSESTAIVWWNRAADKGDEEAQQNVALVTAGMHIEGELNSAWGKEYWNNLE